MAFRLAEHFSVENLEVFFRKSKKLIKSWILQHQQKLELVPERRGNQGLAKTTSCNPCKWEIKFVSRTPRTKLGLCSELSSQPSQVDGAMRSGSKTVPRSAEIADFCE